MSAYNTTFSYNNYDQFNGQMGESYDSNNRYREEQSFNYDKEPHREITSQRETTKNIKLLHEVINASVVGPEPEQTREPSVKRNEKTPKRSKSKSNDQDDPYDKWMDLFMEYVKEPIIMIVLYIILHSEYVQDIIVNHLPSNYNNPNNVIKFFGTRGFIYVVAYYVVRNYKC